MTHPDLCVFLDTFSSFLLFYNRIQYSYSFCKMLTSTINFLCYNHVKRTFTLCFSKLPHNFPLTNWIGCTHTLSLKYLPHFILKLSMLNSFQERRCQWSWKNRFQEPLDRNCLYLLYFIIKMNKLKKCAASKYGYDFDILQFQTWNLNLDKMNNCHKQSTSAWDDFSFFFHRLFHSLNKYSSNPLLTKAVFQFSVSKF